VPTVTIYPISTLTGQWTPSSGGGDHHLLVDEPNPPNESDYIRALGEGKIERFLLGPVDAAIERVTAVSVKVRLKGTPSPNSPAIRVALLLNGGTIASYEGGCATGGVFASLVATITGLNILRNDFNSGAPTLEIITRDGDTGYPDFIEE
jgi:hypothetical protein